MSVGARRWLLVATVASVVMLGERPVCAHQFRPVLVHLIERTPGLFAVSFTRDIGPGSGSLQVPTPAQCRELTEPHTRLRGPVRVTRWTIDCGVQGLTGARVAISGLAASRRSGFVDVRFANGSRFRATLYDERASVLITDSTSPASAATTAREDSVASGDPSTISWLYIRLGARHIASGVDHLLFLVALLLLVGIRARRLLATITAFTIGHSLTLALATVGATALPQAPIEALIALSVLWLAMELVRPPARRTVMSTHPWLVTLGFGLLHGFGFAGALASVGVPQADIALSLLSFNIGVELGQLAFVGACVAVAAAARRLMPAVETVLRPATLAYPVGGLACYYVLERIATLWRGG